MNEELLTSRFRDLLTLYRDNGIVFRGPGGRGAYYTIDSVEPTYANVKRLNGEKDEPVYYSTYTNRREYFAERDRILIREFSNTVAVYTTCSLGDIYEFTDRKDEIAYLPTLESARVHLSNLLRQLPVSRFLNQSTPLVPAAIYSVVQAVRNKALTENRIELEWFVSACLETLKTLGSEDVTEEEVAEVFFNLAERPFWLLAYENPSNFLRHYPDSLDALNKSVRFAMLKPAFWEVICNDLNNQSLLDLISSTFWPSQDALHSNVPVNTQVTEKQPLFMEQDVYREILYSIEHKKNVILQGPPGVGKTWIAKKLALDLCNGDAARTKFVQFHQSYAYEDFVQGFRPDGNGGFRRTDQVFFRFCEKARADGKRCYLFMIDEINRGNLSKIFGELLMLIEADKRSKEYALSLTYSTSDDVDFFIPDNVFILGMMNTADRNLSLVDYALRRRFKFIDLEPGFANAEFYKFLAANGVDASTVERIAKNMTQVNKWIKKTLGAGHQVGHSFFCPDGKEPSYGQSWYENVIQTEVQPLLAEYFVHDPELVTKLIRILRS